MNITYLDKSQDETPYNPAYWNAQDANEIKAAINSKADKEDLTGKANVSDLATKANQSALNEEMNIRLSGYTYLETAISNEANLRLSGYTLTTNNINAISGTTNTLSANLNNEISIRSLGHTALQNQINNISTGIGTASPTDLPTNNIKTYNVSIAGTYTNFSNVIVTTGDTNSGLVQLTQIGTGTTWTKVVTPIPLGNYSLKSDFDGIVNTSGTTTSLFNGATDSAFVLSMSINEGASKVWVATNRSVIVPVIAGHTIKIEGRNGQTITISGIWLGSNSHVLGETPNYATGDFNGSYFSGDVERVVPSGATFLYILLDVPRALTAKITDLTLVPIYRVKSSVLPDYILTDKIDTTITGGTGRVADAIAFKKVYDSFETVTNSLTLFNGSTDSTSVLSQSINEGAVKDWRDTNKCALVPVIAGHTIKIEGRTGQSLGLTNLWLLDGNHITGQIPNYYGGSFTPAYFVGDVERVVPSGATYLYCITDTTRAVTLKITDLTSSIAFKVLPTSIPTSIQNGLNTNTTAIAALQTTVKIVATRYTDVAIARDSNLYFDALTTELDKVKTLNFIPFSSNTTLLRGVKNIKYKPVSSAGNFDTTFILRDGNFNVVDTKLKTIRTVARTGGTGTKRVMFLGDSFIHIGLIAREVYSLLTTDGDYNIQQLGTIPGQFAGAMTEGYSGWQWNNFLNLNSAPVGGVATINPFRSGGALNIANYFEVNGYSGIDLMVINLGVNDFNFASTVISDVGIANIIGYAKTFVNAVLAYAPNCKIIINLPTIGGMDFGTNNFDQSFRKYNCQRGALAYIANFDNGLFHANVSLCDAGQWVDRQFGYTTTTINSADRLSGITELKFNDPVHPNTSGFNQMADAVYSKIRSVWAGNLG